MKRAAEAALDNRIFTVEGWFVAPFCPCGETVCYS